MIKWMIHDQLIMMIWHYFYIRINPITIMLCKRQKGNMLGIFVSLSISRGGRSTDHLTKYGKSILFLLIFNVLFLSVDIDIENEEEPIHLDLGPVDYSRRLTELQRRNLSQPKHLRTAYALETMDQDPDDFSASFIRKGATNNEDLSARQRVVNENQKGSEVRYFSR